MDGDSYYARRLDFQNLQESCCGFGNSESEAVIDLIKQEHIDDIDAIEKLIEERYVAVNGTDYVFDKEKHDKTYITRQEAYEKAKLAMWNYEGETSSILVKEDFYTHLRNAFGIKEDK